MVILHRAAIPLVKPQFSGRNAHLASDIGHSLIRQLAAAARDRGSCNGTVLGVSGPRAAALPPGTVLMWVDRDGVNS